MPPKTFSQPITLKNQAIVKNIPSTYVMFLGLGQTVEQGRFYRFYQRAQARGWHLETLTSDHNAQVSHPQQLVALLENILSPPTSHKAIPEDDNEPVKPAREKHELQSPPINE
jgi:hypothetical protein